MLAPKKTNLFSPCLFKRHSVSQALCSAWFVVSLGFACWRYAGLWSFWPLALVQQAQAAIVFAVLCRLGGAALFRSSRPSPNSGYPFWLLALTFRSSRPAFCGRLTSPVSIFKGLEVWVHIEVSIVISFGLEIFASVFVFGFVMEVFMKNSIAFFTSVFACVWCGIAFLRSSGEKKFQPEREISAV